MFFIPRDHLHGRSEEPGSRYSERHGKEFCVTARFQGPGWLRPASLTSRRGQGIIRADLSALPCSAWICFPNFSALETSVPTTPWKHWNKKWNLKGNLNIIKTIPWSLTPRFFFGMSLLSPLQVHPTPPSSPAEVSPSPWNVLQSYGWVLFVNSCQAHLWATSCNTGLLAPLCMTCDPLIAPCVWRVTLVCATANLGSRQYLIWPRKFTETQFTYTLFTILEWTIHWFLVYSQNCTNIITIPLQKIPITLKRSPMSISSHSPSLLPPPPLKSLTTITTVQFLSSSNNLWLTSCLSF